MKDERFEMRVSAELLARVDEWRQGQPALPTRAAAIRALIETALADHGGPLPTAFEPTDTPLDGEPAVWIRGRWLYTQTSALRAIGRSKAEKHA